MRTDSVVWCVCVCVSCVVCVCVWPNVTYVQDGQPHGAGCRRGLAQQVLRLRGVEGRDAAGVGNSRGKRA
jgi:hypothetical protein